MIAMKKYIITKSASAADILKESGYTLLSNKDGVWTFYNDGKQLLSADDRKDMAYSNKLFL